MLSLRRSQRAFFSGASMREGYSITDDATVVRTAAAPEVSAAAEYAKTPYPAGIR